MPVLDQPRRESRVPWIDARIQPRSPCSRVASELGYTRVALRADQRDGKPMKAL